MSNPVSLILHKFKAEHFDEQVTRAKNETEMLASLTHIGLDSIIRLISVNRTEIVRTRSVPHGASLAEHRDSIVKHLTTYALPATAYGT